MSLSVLLVQFVFRLSFGVAIAMGVTPSKLVTSGFYRVHLWVLMGLHTVAALVVLSNGQSFQYHSAVVTLAIGLAIASFVGAGIWLYENARLGVPALYLVGLGSLLAAALATNPTVQLSGRSAGLLMVDLISSGLVLGITLAAMFLGHWYLNTPTMQLVPLKRLVLLMSSAIVARSILCAIGLAIQIGNDQAGPIMMFLALRWLSGLIGTLVLARLTWLTLRVPNTQSATGILYAIVILTFIGELTSMLLSVDGLYPL